MPTPRFYQDELRKREAIAEKARLQEQDAKDNATEHIARVLDLGDAAARLMENQDFQAITAAAEEYFDQEHIKLYFPETPPPAQAHGILCWERGFLANAHFVRILAARAEAVRQQANKNEEG